MALNVNIKEAFILSEIMNHHYLAKKKHEMSSDEEKINNKIVEAINNFSGQKQVIIALSRRELNLLKRLIFQYFIALLREDLLQIDKDINFYKIYCQVLNLLEDNDNEILRVSSILNMNIGQ